MIYPLNKLFFVFIVGVFVLSSCSRFTTPADAKLKVSTKTVNNGMVYTPPSNGMPGRWRSSSSTIWYIQKGNEEKVRLKPKNLIKAVEDNEEALRYAKAYKREKNLWLATLGASIGMIVYGVSNSSPNPNNELRPREVVGGIGLMLIPISTIVFPIRGSNKAKKAIKIYNGL